MNKNRAIRNIKMDQWGGLFTLIMSYTDINERTLERLEQIHLSTEVQANIHRGPGVWDLLMYIVKKEAFINN